MFIVQNSPVYFYQFFFDRFLKILSTTVPNTNNSLPGYFGIMATRHVQFCCIFAVTKDKFDYF